MSMHPPHVAAALDEAIVHVRAINAVLEGLLAPEAPQVAPGEAVEPVAWGEWDTMIGRNRLMMVTVDKSAGYRVPLYAHPPKEAEGVMPRNPEMDAMVKGMHASEAFKVPNVAKELRAALQSTYRDHHPDCHCYQCLDAEN